MVDFHTPTAAVLSYGKMFGKIAQNISNVNTNGFKGNNSAFHDITLRASRLEGEADIRVMGGLEATGNALDVAVSSGEGMFALGEPVYRATDINEISHYTRDGGFSANLSTTNANQFDLVHGASGRVALGYPADTINPTNANLAPIQIEQSITVSGQAVPLVKLEIDEAGIVNATYQAVDGASSSTIVQVARLAVNHIKEYQVEEEPDFNVYQLKSEAYGDIQFLTDDAILTTEHIERSNVRIESMFTAMIQTQRTVQTVTKTITTQDEMLQRLSEIA